MPRHFFSLTIMSAVVCAIASTAVFASSHREAPFISELPKVDGTDFYMFRSYGPDSTPDSITLLANYQPLQDPYGGPNYFSMDPNALYEIHIDNDGDNREDLTFQFRFTHTYRRASLPLAPPLIGDINQPVSVPLINVGPGDGTPPTGVNTDPVGPGVNDNDGLNLVENYQVTVVRGDRRSDSDPTPATNLDATGSDTTVFRKPVDNIGEKTIPDYAAYANNHIFGISIPGCDADGRVFVGQRKEGFVVNLGAIFDRINVDPTGARDRFDNTLDDKNVTTLALELPTACLTDPDSDETVIGGWTTASLRQARVLNPLPATLSTEDGEINTPAVEGGPWTQVSRLGSPLVNEVVIGLAAKDRFNASEPVGDLNSIAGFVVFPTLPALIQSLFGLPAPATPRTDLVSAFVTGIRTSVDGEPRNFTQPQAITDANVDTDGNGVVDPAELASGGEMLRLNTAFPGGTPPQRDAQNSLGFLACDLNGFPNGRRPIDDVVDIELSVVEGAITADNPNGIQTCDVSGADPAPVDGMVVNDGALPDAADYLQNFPYLNTPLPGATSP